MQGQDRSIIIRWQRPDTIADRRPRATPPRVSGDGAVSFNRMPRIQQPLPRGEVKLPSPPTADHGTSFNWISTLMPLAGVIVTASVYGGLRRDWRLALPMIIMSGFSATGSLVARMIQRVQHRRRAEREAAAYAQVLEQRRSELAELRRDQQRIRHAVDPDLETVLERARTRDPRLWARRPSDSDFLQVRLGLGSLPSTVSVSAPQPAVPTPHLVEVQKLAAEYAAVPDVPVTLSLRDGPAGIAGALERRTAAARALICHLAAHHAPHEVRLRAIMTPDDLADWHWLKWLPHTQALRGGIPTLAAGEAAAQAVLKDLLEVLQYRQNRLDTAQHGDPTPRWPWLVVLATDVDRVRNDPAIHLLLSPIGRELHATAVFLVDRIPLIPTGCQTVVEILPDGQAIRSALDSDGTRTCQLEGADVSLSDALARCLTPLCAEALRPDGALPSQVRLLDLMGIADVTTHDVAAHWLQRSGGQSLQVPIGQRRGRQPMILDLNHTGHGPHGLVAGTTGSGKSELLQTLVVALALTHHPYDVGFVLVDFKGGGAFSDLVDLPHTQGFVTDLSGRLTERALLALRAEVDRRKRLFNAAGVNDIVRYQQRYWRGEVSQPLPRLVVIVDEFAELVSDHPDFIDGLIGIARIGRSLGVHLILATQSPAGVVKQQIWANARFRICLRVESRQESLEMLHRPEAADLPRQPGRGYFQVGNNDVFELFQVARVASEYPTPAADAPPAEDETPITIERILPLGARIPLLDTAPSCQEDDRSADRRTDIEAVVERLAQIAQQLEIEKLPSPWPDPLPARVALPDLLAETGAGGWDGTDWQPSPSRLRLSPPIGLLDDPANQRQMPVLLDLRQQDGQLIIIGAPGSGKTMLGRTLVSGLARTHTPAELHLYLLEFGGQALQLFRGLPHVGGVFTPLDRERVRRLFRR
ncbi:MAG: FtsK/SpoIIIE domain-containing protein, partial [Anaerolineae bacterium]